MEEKTALLTEVVSASNHFSRMVGMVILLVVLLAMFYIGMYVYWNVSGGAAGSGQRSRGDPRDPSGKTGRKPVAPPRAGGAPVGGGSRGTGMLPGVPGGYPGAAPGVGMYGGGGHGGQAGGYPQQPGEVAAGQVLHRGAHYGVAPVHQRGGTAGPGMGYGAGGSGGGLPPPMPNPVYGGVGGVGGGAAPAPGVGMPPPPPPTGSTVYTHKPKAAPGAFGGMGGMLWGQQSGPQQQQGPPPKAD